MRKASTKYFVDVLLFVDLCSVSVLGLLLAFAIPRGRGRENQFLGLHRHEWADIHLWLSLLFVGLVALHVWLSWRWVLACSRRYLGGGHRTKLALLCGAWLVVLLVAWLAIKL